MELLVVLRAVPGDILAVVAAAVGDFPAAAVVDSSKVASRQTRVLPLLMKPFFNALPSSWPKEVVEEVVVVASVEVPEVVSLTAPPLHQPRPLNHRVDTELLLLPAVPVDIPVVLPGVLPEDITLLPLPPHHSHPAATEPLKGASKGVETSNSDKLWLLNSSGASTKRVKLREDAAVEDTEPPPHNLKANTEPHSSLLPPHSQPVVVTNKPLNATDQLHL